ncbi:hypothetical protein DPSP01_004108 [Paraphaeosphaeria sporulosa]
MPVNIYSRNPWACAVLGIARQCSHPGWDVPAMSNLSMLSAASVACTKHAVPARIQSMHFVVSLSIDSHVKSQPRADRGLQLKNSRLMVESARERVQKRQFSLGS